MRLLATVTLNPNQLRSHLLPLVSLPEVDEIVLVADEVPPQIQKVRAVIPPAQRTKLLGRAASKLFTCAQVARRIDTGQNFVHALSDSFPARSGPALPIRRPRSLSSKEVGFPPNTRSHQICSLRLILPTLK